MGTRQPGPIGPQHPTEKRLIAAQEINKAKRVIKSPPSENLSIADVRLKVIGQQGLVNQKNPYNYKSLPGLTMPKCCRTPALLTRLLDHVESYRLQSTRNVFSFKTFESDLMPAKSLLLSTRMNVRLAAFVLIGLFACTLIGCGNANRSKLVGDWGIAQPDEVMERIEASEADSGEPQESRMVLRFLPSGRLETKTKMGSVDQKKEGTWKMLSFESATNSMVISCELNAQTSEHTITFVDENKIELVPPNMAGLTMEVTFKRQ